nr:PREDICTED: TANK-binding kinase 1-binding protein 1 [Latimeria chalumnae]XP_014340560.1 PREDICTED: TANK-binding kinase 1-binding protein 1 [Latimeria chalumnae]|eukprot:XP_005990127.1 PREDICTED: TANK-binding kinase 1-binding protein 1 [Latimeria chalumnae]
MTTMDSLFADDISIITQNSLCEHGEWVDRPGSEISGEMYSASHFALITAYDDIKKRLTTLEKENSTLRRRAKQYELKFPVLNDFSLIESKDISLLKTENVSLQQQLNHFQHELQKSKEREEQLEEVIRAYEKICLEKTSLKQDLDQMTTLAEKHVGRIRTLEQQLRVRDSSLQSLNAQLQNKEAQYLPLHPNHEMPHMLDVSLQRQFSRNLEQLNDLKVQRLEAELEGARRELQGAQHREGELKSECERLQVDLAQLQENHRQELTVTCNQRDMEWIQKVGDEQVNLALAYTELTEELCRLRSVSTTQSEILRKLLQGQTHAHAHAAQRHSPVPQQRHSPIPQRHSPIVQRRSPVVQCQSPAGQRLSPVAQCQSPLTQRKSPVPQRRSLVHNSNTLGSSFSRHNTQHLRASFQGRRSYSEASEATMYSPARSVWLQPDEPTSPKHRSYNESYSNNTRSSPLTNRVTGSFEDHLHFDKQSSDEEEWAVSSPPSPEGRVIQCASSCAGFPIPDTSTNRSCAAYTRTEHAQSWPSINLWIETEDSDVRSCPLCQLTFPVGYPDDALIKHIDTHLENSKI